jgi:hypothetical protein
VTAVWTWEGGGAFGAYERAVQTWKSAETWVTATGGTAVVQLAYLVTTVGLGARYVPTGLAWESARTEDGGIQWVPVSRTAV